MLLNFSVKNYLSIREEVNLSMLTSSMKETFDIPKTAFISLSNDLQVVPLAAIYGANASGKSNLLDALRFLKTFVLTSLARDNVQDKIPVEPFAFSLKSEKEPSEFEITFSMDEKIYRYGFQASKDLIYEEWLFEKDVKPRSKEKELFYRDSHELAYHTSFFKVGKIIKEQNLAKENVLILTLAHQLNDETAKTAILWFSNLNVLKGQQDEFYEGFSKSQIQKQTAIADEMEKLVVFADTNIQKLSTISVDEKTEVTTSHILFNEQDEPVGIEVFLMNKQESDGTKKLFNLSGPILHSLNFQQVLVIDEMDSKLHPNLMEKLVLMFQDMQINRKGAQLIFATHNTNLLSTKLLRRDQVWITEKNEMGATQLYSIADYKTDKGKARNTEALEQNYIDGKYGGVPFLGEFENFLEAQRHEQATT